MRGTMAQLVRVLAYGAEGPRIEIWTEAKKYHVMTDWLHVLCATARHFTLICLVDLSVSWYRSWEILQSKCRKGVHLASCNLGEAK